MLILTTRKLEPEHVRRIEDVARQAGAEVQVVIAESEPQFEANLAQAAIIYGTPLRPGQAAAAPNLRWLQVDFAGVEKLPLQELAAHNVLLTNGSGLHAETIADHVFMFLLAHCRSLPAFLALQQHGRWERGAPVRETSGLRLGIIGLGHIGQEIARRALAFGMRVRGTRRTGLAIEGVEVFPPERMHDVLAQSDVVVLATPLTPATRGLMDARAFQAMPRGAFFINIARGGCVDQAALVTALQSGHLAGAGLDVTDPEPLPPDHPLWHMPNVMITPHVSGQMRDYTGRAVSLFCENLERFLRREPLLNVVNLTEGY